MTLPTSPTDGQVHTLGSRSWQYDAASDRWRGRPLGPWQVLTQAAYDELTPDADTVYLIVG